MRGICSCGCLMSQIAFVRQTCLLSPLRASCPRIGRLCLLGLPLGTAVCLRALVTGSDFASLASTASSRSIQCSLSMAVAIQKQLL